MDVFRLPVPEWTDDFVVALKSIGMYIFRRLMGINATLIVKHIVIDR